jgi:hypothetical protein
MFLPSLLRKAFASQRAEQHAVRSLARELTVWADLARLDQFMSDDTGTAEAANTFTLMDSASRGFGTDVAAFIDHCCEQHILRIAAPVTAVGIEATLRGDYRDGGFLVMVTIADRITVASGQLTSRVFHDADDLPRKVLAVVVDVADHTYREFLRTADSLTGIPS